MMDIGRKVLSQRQFLCTVPNVKPRDQGLDVHLKDSVELINRREILKTIC